MRFITALFIVLSLFCTLVHTKVYDIHPTDNWLTTLNSLVAGDTANFHSGSYTYSGSGYTALTLNGDLNNPITIQAAPGESSKPLFNQVQNQNALNIVAGHDFTISGLAFSGTSIGVRMGSPNGSPMYNVMFVNNEISNTVGTGFTANFEGQVFYNMSIMHNEVYNTGASTGECFYLGCNNDGCRIYNSFIYNNLCHDTQQATQGFGSGVQLKHGSYNNVIQDNVFWNLKGPGVLAYGDLGRGKNTIVGNIVVTTSDNGIQATASADIFNNIVYGTSSDGISIIQNPGGATIANITIKHNTVLEAAGAGMRLTSFTSTGNFLVANNAIYCPGSSKGAIYAPGDQTGVPYYRNGYVGGSAPTGVSSPSGVYSVGSEASDLVDASNYNVYPKSSSSNLIGQGDGAHSLAYDFNYQARSATAPTVGAYEYSTPNNPGWKVATSAGAFKSNNNTISVPNSSPSPSYSVGPLNPSSYSAGSSAASSLSSWLFV